MILRSVVGWLICSLVALPVVEQESQVVPQVVPRKKGIVQSVTVYRDQALVIREIMIPDGVRNRMVTVSELPGELIQYSDYVVGDDGVVIRAVRVSPKASAIRPAPSAQFQRVRFNF